MSDKFLSSVPARRLSHWFGPCRPVETGSVRRWLATARLIPYLIIADEAPFERAASFESRASDWKHHE